MSEKEFSILRGMKKSNERLIATLKTDESLKDNSMREGYILALMHQNKEIKQEIRKVI